MKNSELKPCPFCGGEAEIVQDDIFWMQKRIRCKDENCFAGYGVTFHDFDVLLTAWNQRAERTCENMEEYKGCSNFKCSECGYTNYWSLEVPASDINYCPNCGARVVE